MNKIDYKSVGVDIDKGNKFVKMIKEICKSDNIGGFSGLFPYKDITFSSRRIQMNNNIILLEKLYENMNNAYIEKERALSEWDYDNEFLDNMNRSCTNGRNMDLFNYYIKEKMYHDVVSNIYYTQHKNIMKYIIKKLPIDCINYLTSFIQKIMIK